MCSSDLELVPIAGLVAVIVALGVYPHFIVRRTEASTVPRVQLAAYIEHAVAQGLPYKVAGNEGIVIGAHQQ